MKTVSTMNDCPVCYELITDIDTLSCGHLVHKDCVLASGKAQCPICRCELPQYYDKVVELLQEPQRWGTLDKLVSLGWLTHADIPIIDELLLPSGDDLSLVKAAVLLHAIKQVLV